MTEQTLEFDYQRLFDEAPCGHVVVGADGTIHFANTWLSDLLGFDGSELHGRRLRDIFAMAARILYETNLAPLLKLQRNVSEVTLDLKRGDGVAIPVIMAARLLPDPANGTTSTLLTFMHAGERRRYERELVTSRDHAEDSLKREQQDGELREQFMAILGHDLRNPLSAMTAASRMLAKEPLSGKATKVVELMQGSALRMSGLIDNVLDFARARLGGGIALDIQPMATPAPLIDQVVQELRSVNPGRQIVTSCKVSGPIRCDASKLGQLASNLLGNALSHGDEAQAVQVHAETGDDGSFRFWVANGGTPIPPDVLPRLFDPFVRGQAHGYKDGLGLGLYIAHEIAKAHGGRLTVASSDLETRFTFEMPGSA